MGLSGKREKKGGTSTAVLLLFSFLFISWPSFSFLSFGDWAINELEKENKIRRFSFTHDEYLWVME